jgi:hypothetical protein
MAVVKANYVKRGVGERETAKANIRYIQERPGRDREKFTRPLFNNAGYLGRLEAYQFIDEAAKEGRYFYRFKLSPDPATEDTKRDLNMRKLTRQMMKRLEKRFKTTIPWAGSLHDDHTDIRHVHILAALPRRLQKYELEALIREVTTLCQEQRRALEPEKDRVQWRETARHERPTFAQPRKFGKRLHLSSGRQVKLAPLIHHRGVRPAKVLSSCTCPHCHYPQSHNGRGAHTCVSCGWTLHKKRERTLSRKGRAWDRSL